MMFMGTHRVYGSRSAAVHIQQQLIWQGAIYADSQDMDLSFLSHFTLHPTLSQKVSNEQPKVA